MKRLLLCLAAILVSLGAYSQEVVVEATPPTYLRFQHQPFVVNGTTYLPLRETAEVLALEIVMQDAKITLKKADKTVSFNQQDLIQLPDYLSDTKTRPHVTFAPLRTLAEGLKLDFSIKGNVLFLDAFFWKIDQKLIVVDRSRQRIYAFEGLKQVYDCRTCTGKPSTPTSTGMFQVYRKTKGKHTVVGKPWGGVMYNPLYFNGCTALHGSTEMRSRPSSHGCCRLYYRDADWLYKWTPIGTRVYVIP